MRRSLQFPNQILRFPAMTLLAALSAAPALAQTPAGKALPNQVLFTFSASPKHAAEAVYSLSDLGHVTFAAPDRPGSFHNAAFDAQEALKWEKELQQRKNARQGVTPAASPVPEPSTTASLGSGALGLSGLLLHARKKKRGSTSLSSGL